MRWLAESNNAENVKGENAKNRHPHVGGG